MRWLVVVLLAVVASVSCGTGIGEPDAGRPRSAPPESYDGTWKLTSGTSPQGQIPLVPDYSITMAMSEGRAEGRSACNRYGAEIKTEGSQIKFGGGGGTDMDCSDPVMESEAAYLDALWHVRSISLSQDGNLVMTGEDVELLFESLPPPPTKELIGPTWQLEGMIEGRGSDATATNAEPAELMMSRDGTFTGSTGCRKLTGEWSEDGDSILFHTMAAEGRCSKHLRTQDSYVVGVLGDGFTAAIDGNRLTVYNVRGNLGLIYRAD